MMPRLGRVCVLALATVGAVVSRPALAMSAMVDQAATLEENELRQGDKIIRLVKYDNQLFRRIEVSDLNGLAVGDQPLHGLLVCVEGKFSKPVPPNYFLLYGSESPFAYHPKQRGLITGLMKGDNVWVAGMGEKLPRGGGCYVQVQAVIRLGSDMSLFSKRFDYYREQGKWKRLLELGRWIENSGEQGTAVLEDSNRYRALRDKAFRQAVKIRQQEVPPGDAEGQYQLARMLMELFGRVGSLDAADHLLAAVAVKPDHEGATDMLVELGYVRYSGEWMTKDERDDRERKKRAALAARTAAENPNVKPDTTPDATEAKTPKVVESKELPVPERMRRIAELEMRIRMSVSGMKSVADEIGTESESVARRLVWIYANVGDTIGLEALLSAQSSEHTSVRKDVADALAGTGEFAVLSDVITGDKDEGVRSHAIDALASVGTKESAGRLVTVLQIVQGATRDKVVAALSDVTAQRFENNTQWLSWWQANRDEYKGPAER